jgi:hypothetical protein
MMAKCKDSEFLKEAQGRNIVKGRSEEREDVEPVERCGHEQSHFVTMMHLHSKTRCALYESGGYCAPDEDDEHSEHEPDDPDDHAIWAEEDQLGFTPL